MSETYQQAWRRRNGLPPLKPQTPHPTLQHYTQSRALLENTERSTAWQERWERDWHTRWELRDGKYYPRAR
jgi:hypothetical protein